MRGMPGTAAEIHPQTLPDDVAALKALVAELLDALKKSQTREAHLEHRLQHLLRQRFGPHAEKVDADQLLMFAQEILAQAEPAAEPPAQPKAGARRRRHGRRKLEGNLPRIRVDHDLPEAERACPCCGGQRRRMGEETSEQYDYEPAKVFVVEHVRAKYVCPNCEGEIVTADKPPQAIEKCVAGPGLLAQVIVSKYGDHLPLHRLEKIFKRHDVTLQRSTMCGWTAQCAEALDPLVALMRQEVLSSAVIHTDDSPVPVQDKGRGRTKTGRFWVYVGDEVHRYAVFDYTPDRTRAGPLDLLAGYKGYLQADAYAGYDELYRSGAVLEVACWAHARRKYYEARMTDPARCHQAMAYIRLLYDIERQGKKLNLDAEALRELRQSRSVPPLNEFRQWLQNQIVQVLPKSPVADAINYQLNRWESFTRYTTDGVLAIDNNTSENALRRVALGRKNWLFCGSDNGGRTAAVLFSLIASAQLHNVEPYRWLRDVLTRIASTPVKALRELLPDRWAASS